MGISRVVEAVLEATSVSMATINDITNAMSTVFWPSKNEKLSPSHFDSPDI